MNAELLKIRDAIETVIEDGGEDDLGLAAMILDRVVQPLLAEHEKQVRGQIADSIDAELADPNSDYERGLSVAAEIARGEASSDE
jgi:hypothetical protein